MSASGSWGRERVVPVIGQQGGVDGSEGALVHARARGGGGQLWRRPLPRSRHPPSSPQRPWGQTGPCGGTCQPPTPPPIPPPDVSRGGPRRKRQLRGGLVHPLARRAQRRAPRRGVQLGALHPHAGRHALNAHNPRAAAAAAAAAAPAAAPAACAPRIHRVASRRTAARQAARLRGAPDSSGRGVPAEGVPPQAQLHRPAVRGLFR